MIQTLRPVWLSLALFCTACASGPKPLALPDGTFRSEINPPLEMAANTPKDVAARIASQADSDHSDLSIEKDSDLAVTEPKIPDPEKIAKTTIEIPELIWSLQKGETIRAELGKWAKDADWSLVWRLDKDWVIPSNSQFSGSFDTAASKVIETLASNGVLIHANFYSANKTLVVTGPGVTPQ